MKLVSALLCLVLLATAISAQEATALPESDPPVASDTPTPSSTPTLTPTPTPITLSVTGSEPRSLTFEQAATLSVYGSNFSAESRVRLVGYGILATTFINERALTAQIPNNVPLGMYRVEVSDPLHGTLASPHSLAIVAPSLVLPSSTPQATPTFVPGKPMLVARAFSAFPSTIRPMQTTQLLIEIVNQGSASALGISLVLDGGKFVPSVGQAAATLDRLAVGEAARLTFNVEAMSDIGPGPNSIPFSINYRNTEGEAFSSKAAVSINISADPQVASVVLARTLSEPSIPQAGQRLMLTMLFQNNGSSTASQVQVRLPAGSGAPLLPAEEGDTFSLGDLAVGASLERRFPMTVASDAKSGPQFQPVTITYLQGTERKEVQSALSVRIEPSQAPTPLLLLDSYRADSEALAPGQTFTLTVTLNNIGSADASDALVTFGTVSASAPSTGSGSDNSGSTNNGGETSTTPSTTFAPLGSGETSYIGTLPQGQKSSLSKDFIVNGSVKSGLYTLPVSVRYRDADGKSAQANFQLTLLVVAPLRALLTLDTPAPDEMFVGDMLELAWTLQNLGSSDARFESLEISAEGLEVLSGASSFVGTIKADRKANFSTSLLASLEGEGQITLTLHYLDEMNRSQTLTEAYRIMIVAAPIIEEPNMGEEPPLVEPPTPTPAPERPWFQRLLLGLMGLGS